MASTIAAVTTSGGGVVTTADATGNLNLLAGTTTVVALTTAGAAVSGTLGVTGVATLGNGAILGTPASGTVTNLTGTASININGTVGATTPAAATCTTLTVNSTANCASTLSVFSASPSSSQQGVLFRNTFNTGGNIFSTGSAPTNDFILWVGGSGTQGAITGNGAGINYSSNSDYRLKENVASMTGALAKVAQLKPCTYIWKFDGSDGQGFIAHELQEVFPEAVTGKKDDVETYIDEDGNKQTETYTDKDGNEQIKIKPQGVDTSFLVATLTAAIQELKAIIDTQATRIAALEAK